MFIHIRDKDDNLLHYINANNVTNIVPNFDGGSSIYFVGSVNPLRVMVSIEELRKVITSKQ